MFSELIIQNDQKQNRTWMTSSKKKSAIEVLKEEYMVSITSQTYCNHGRPLATPSSPLPPPEIRAYKGVISHQCPLTRPWSKLSTVDGCWRIQVKASELCVCVHFWSNKTNEIMTCFFPILGGANFTEFFNPTFHTWNLDSLPPSNSPTKEIPS